MLNQISPYAAAANGRDGLPRVRFARRYRPSGPERGPFAAQARSAQRSPTAQATTTSHLADRSAPKTTAPQHVAQRSMLGPASLRRRLPRHGQNIAHQKATPQNKYWILSCVFQWMFSGIPSGMTFVSGMFQRIVTRPMDVSWNLQWIVSGKFRWMLIFVIPGV